MPCVEFTSENLEGCVCPGCPVQGSSDCAEERAEKVERILQGQEEIADPQILVRVYCAMGITTCDGYNGSFPCMCPGCPVWLSNNLTSRYYCLRGAATAVDMR